MPRHLTMQRRDVIANMYAQGASQASVARDLGRSPLDHLAGVTPERHGWRLWGWPESRGRLAAPAATTAQAEDGR